MRRLLHGGVAVLASLALTATASNVFAQTTTQSGTTTTTSGTAPAPQTTTNQQTTTTTPPPAQAPTNVTVQSQPQQPAPQPVGVTTTTSASAPLVVEKPHAEGAESESVEGRRPNVALITTGAILLGGAFTASAIVSGVSGHQGDNHLWVPIVGPWADLGDRGNSSPNDNETFNKVMLATDGVLQAVGTIELVSGFIFTEKRAKSRTHDHDYEEAKLKKPTVHFMPMHVRDGAGGGLVGTF